MAIPALLCAYLLGGVTFIPLLLAVFLARLYFLSPRWVPDEGRAELKDSTADFEDETLKEKLGKGSHEPDVAAGYFAVCREYVPGGVNGKPPERTTPAGDAIAAESPSVYQQMFHQIFDRNKSQAPSIEAGRPVKKARNVFYVVLRLGHLMLFDNSEQLEVRHVIALTHYDVDIYAGGESIPEGELWIKRNCIRLARKRTSVAVGPAFMPFYLFSDNCSEKEDFYHALLHSHDHTGQNPADFPKSQLFDNEDMFKLIRQIHVSEETSQTRWLNAMMGRLFLAMYRTSEVEDFVRMKVMKKMSRVAKPAFIKSLGLEKIDLGNSAPVLSNLKLKEMTVDGALTIEGDMKYTGNFKVVIAAVARIELGSRFKPREVNLLLAAIFKRVEGHILLRIKPPPSNRIWVTFESVPKTEMSIEPVVSSRQITYGVVLRAIESKVREVIADTVVLPNWDDLPFTDTQAHPYRGGIWEATTKVESRSSAATADDSNPRDQSDTEADVAVDSHNITPQKTRENSTSTPDVDGLASSPASDSQKIDVLLPPESPSADITSRELRSRSKPRVMRSSSFGAVAMPIVSTGPAVVNASGKTRRHDAASTMKVLSSQSPITSPTLPSSGGPALDSSQTDLTGTASLSETSESVDTPRQGRFREDVQDAAVDSPVILDGAVASIPEDTPSRSSSNSSRSKRSSASARSTPVRTFQKTLPPEKRQAINQSIASATTAAKSWGLGFLNRVGDGRTNPGARDSLVASGLPSGPVGRGQPLPPPGTPLPKPERPGWSENALNSLRRKPVAPPPLPARPPVPNGTIQSTPSAGGDEMPNTDSSNLTDRTSDTVDDEDMVTTHNVVVAETHPGKAEATNDSAADSTGSPTVPHYNQSSLPPDGTPLTDTRSTDENDFDEKAHEDISDERVHGGEEKSDLTDIHFPAERNSSEQAGHIKLPQALTNGSRGSAVSENDDG